MSSTSSHIALEAGTQRPQHRPSLFKLFPFWGYGSVLTACVGVASCITILWFADNHPRDKWDKTFTPTVLLSISVAVINISLHLAHAEGLNVAWWKRAMDQRAPEDHLHESWERADSLYTAVASFHKFDPIALATVFVAFAPVAAPLLQRAVVPVDTGDLGMTEISLSVAQQLPAGWSGYYTGRTMIPALTTSNFTDVINDFTVNQDMWVPATGCDGVCRTSVRAAGFRVNCSDSRVPFDLSPKSNDAGDTITVYPEGRLFASYVNFSIADPGTINIGVLHKNTTECTGDLLVQTCSLTLGTIEYPVIFESQSGTSNKRLDVRFDAWADVFRKDQLFRVIMNEEPFLGHTRNTFRPSAPLEERDGDGFTTIGGVALALQNLYASEANARWIGTRGYEIQTQGALAAGSANLSDPTLMNTCNLTFSNPMSQILYGAYELMFRSAIKTDIFKDTAVPNIVFNQKIVATRGHVPIYQSNFLFLGLAIVFSGLGIIFVTPLFHGFWRLQYFPSMSPIQTAKYLNQQHQFQSDLHSSGTAYEMKKTPGVQEKEVGSQG